MLLPPNDFFAFDPPRGGTTLVGRVLRSVSDHEVTQICEWMLAAAEPGGGQYWLLDVRQDTQRKSVALTQWLAEDFLPRTFQVLGEPLYLAYIFDQDFLAALVKHELYDNWHSATPTGRLKFFYDKAPALAWLAQIRQANTSKARSLLTPEE